MSYLHQNHLKYKRLFNHQGYYVYWTMLPVSLDCPFLSAPSVFSNVYFKLFELFYYLYDKYIENGIKQLILRYSPLQHCILSYFRSNIQHYIYITTDIWNRQQVSLVLAPIVILYIDQSSIQIFMISKNICWN